MTVYIKIHTDIWRGNCYPQTHVHIVKYKYIYINLNGTPICVLRVRIDVDLMVPCQSDVVMTA